MDRKTISKDSKSLAVRSFKIIVLILCFGYYFLNFTDSNSEEILKSNSIALDSKSNKENNLRVCSQNLKRFGEKDFKERDNQTQYLADRIIKSKCEIVAVQEVFGKNESEANKNLRELTQEISLRAGKNYQIHLGETRDNFIRNAYLVAKDSGKVIKTKSLAYKNLEKLNNNQPALHFSRGPYYLYFQPNNSAKKFVFINLHFKSKYNSQKDPTKTKFETYRMQAAETLRKETEKELKSGFIPVMLGDRNSPSESASAEILLGKLELRDFQDNCSLTTSLTASCKKFVYQEPEFVGLFEYRRTHERKYAKSGSHRYKGRESIIDEIIIPKSNLNLVLRDPASTKGQESQSSIKVGYSGQFFKGSDHKLLWVDFAL